MAKSNRKKININIDKLSRNLVSIGLGIFCVAIFVYGINVFMQTNQKIASISNSTNKVAVIDNRYNPSNYDYGYEVQNTDFENMAYNKSLYENKNFSAYTDKVEFINSDYKFKNSDIELVQKNKDKSEETLIVEVKRPVVKEEKQIAEKSKKSNCFENINNSKVLVITYNNLSCLKSGDIVDGSIYIKGVNFYKMPKLIVKGNVYLKNSRGLKIAENSVINGNIFVKSDSSIKPIDNVDFKGQIFI